MTLIPLTISAAALVAALGLLAWRQHRPRLRLKVQQTVPRAMLPHVASAGAAGMDLRALHTVTVPPLGSATIRTGLAFEVPAGHAMLLFSRSGHGLNHGVRLANSVAVIDSDYRGEVLVVLANDSEVPFTALSGDRIAQAVVLPVPAVEVVATRSLSTTERGEGGFGSTGR